MDLRRGACCRILLPALCFLLLPFCYGGLAGIFLVCVGMYLAGISRQKYLLRIYTVTTKWHSQMARAQFELDLTQLVNVRIKFQYKNLKIYRLILVHFKFKKKIKSKH